ncbi:MAG: hypothetical protein N3D75_04130 [Candidatus Aenigmarchaeota archaeon]|nr:hypothetical protein [Candidatus Aenigmarchaeota archaeon]
MKGQTYIVEYLLMFAIAFALFSTISYSFYKQTEYISQKTSASTSKLINRVILNDIIKINTCKSCFYIETYPEIPQKIGNSQYSIRLFKNVTTVLPWTTVNSTALNVNNTFDFSGEVATNKKIKIEINNISKTVKVV